MKVIQLNSKYDYLAPDGSEIRLLSESENGGLAHCILPKGKISKAVKHKTVEEIWYILEGEGEFWRKFQGEEMIIDMNANMSFIIPIGAHFQFRNTGDSPLRILIVTMPPWPNEHEAIEVKDHWNSI